MLVGGLRVEQLPLLPHVVQGPLLLLDLVGRSHVGVWGGRQFRHQLLQQEECREVSVCLVVGAVHVALQGLDSQRWLCPHCLRNPSPAPHDIAA